ncbi:nagb rpia transferase [Pyrrhoderma noxium]|uniref:5-formyltetrahydrofolate cyclo-ligase n=1 Tax=Pyrrhoderma noxium TaxID=2282107 RepID=A0A286U6I4_9AGAM|nr:nagb rpia transferase [Pyrrhoderma noxium]
MMTAIQSSKRSIRQAITSNLRSLSEASVQEQSDSVFNHIISSPIFQRSRTVSCYLSMKGEINTYGIVHEILRRGKTLYVPKIANREDRRMDLLRIYSIEDLESLPNGTWGIKEPTSEWQERRRASIYDDDADTLDLILVPGVAFDNELSRLGHGKGYYDFFINSYSKFKAQPKLVALSLREQILPNDGPIDKTEEA